tara:strand:- start:9152 stop:11089 length:1938 start_codon:yes stop_codon:yes gene_type:complete
MCGISGILQLNNQSLVLRNKNALLDMSNQLIHRGPDDFGDLSLGPINIGFRRLSIIDICGGHQPIHNENKTIWVFCNGEIYNYPQLKDTLKSKGHVFKTSSDSESIVHAYEEYGLDFVHHLNGMFAIAIWDNNKKQLILARDRIGQKPLLYSKSNNQLAFSSELKSLIKWENMSTEIDYESIDMYLKLNYVPEPQTIFKNTFKLLPGHMLIANSLTGKTQIKQYWKFNINRNTSINFEDTKAILESKIKKAVKLRLMSDVPLGTFLSGGLDSSVIAGSASENYAPHEMLTFTMGFENSYYDETSDARLVANRFKTNHIEEKAKAITPDELNKIVWNLDEPFADSSAIPTYLICKAAKQHVTVALSGDGGDELFGGYKRYRNLKLINLLDSIPNSTKYVLLKLIESSRIHKPNSYINEGQINRLYRALQISNTPHQYRGVIRGQVFTQVQINNLISHQMELKFERKSNPAYKLNIHDNIDAYDALDKLMYVDTINYLPGDILTKVDRMSMANSLEVRSPFLDYELIEYVSTIPNEFKIYNGKQKHILKETFKNILPKEILNKPKHGFSAPISQWILNTDLKEFALDCLSENSINNRGLLDYREVAKLSSLAIQGSSSNINNTISIWTKMWNLLLLEIWFRQFKISI